MTPGTTDHVAVMTTVIKDVDAAVDLVFAGLAEAGAGGHLNDEQVVKVVDLFSALAVKALTAFHTAAGVPITHDSIMALLPANPDPLPPPDEKKAPEPPAPLPDVAPEP